MTKAPSYRRARKQVCKALGKLGAFVCKGVFWTCCGSCVLCAVYLIKPRRGGSVVRTQTYDPPRPTTPEPRLRRLTMPLIETQENQKTLEQSQSSFINNLPLEIRRLIYMVTLGGVTIKLRTSSGKPVTQRYRCFSCPCRDSASPPQSGLGLGLALLRTCRQIYSEAIEFLYTSNAFSLSTWDDDYPTLDYMSYYFLPHRLIKVRQLRIDWEVDSFYYNRHWRIESGGNSFEAWKKSWSALRSMTGIRQLRIFLYFRWREVVDCYEEYWKEHELELLDPVKSITAPADFVLVLPDRRCSTNVHLGSSRCVLQLPEEPCPT